MLRKISFGLLLIAFIVCLGLWYEHYQVWQENIRATELNCRINKICFSADGPHTYGFLADRYFCILCFLLFFLAGKLTQPKLISLTVCISSIVLMIYQFWQINDWYLDIIKQFAYYNTEPVFDLLRNSVPFVWLCFSIIIVLLIVQIIDFFKPLINRS